MTRRRLILVAVPCLVLLIGGATLGPMLAR